MGEAYNSLVILGFEVEKLFLAKQSTLISNCSVLVIVSPQRKFMETEADEIKKYLINGGNLLLMLEPGVETGLQKIFKDYGVSWRAGFHL